MALRSFTSPKCLKMGGRVVAYAIIGFGVALIANVVSNMILMPHTPHVAYELAPNPFHNFDGFISGLAGNVLGCSPVTFALGVVGGVTGGLIGQVRFEGDARLPGAGLLTAILGGAIGGLLTWVVQWAVWFWLIPFY